MEQKAQSCIDLVVVVGHLVIIVALAISAWTGRRAEPQRPAAPTMNILESYHGDDNDLK